MSPIVSEQYQFVIGVDTHASTHTLAVLAAATGTVVDSDTFPTTGPGLARALAWIDRRVGEASALIVVEGTGSYGAILTWGHLPLADGALPRRGQVAGQGVPQQVVRNCEHQALYCGSPAARILG